MLGPRRREDFMEEGEAENALVPVIFGPWGDNYGNATDPTWWEFPRYMAGNFTRDPIATLGGFKQPPRRINAVAMTLAEMGVNYVADQALGTCNIAAIENNTGTLGAASGSNAWNAGNCMYLGSIDRAVNNAGIKSPKYRSKTVNWKGTLSISSDVTGYTAPAAADPQALAVYGVRFSMLKAHVVCITLVGEKICPRGRNAGGVNLQPLDLPNWSSIFDYGLSAKNELNVLKAAQGGASLKARFLGSVPKIDYNAQDNYKILFQQRYFVSPQIPIVPIDYYFTISPSTARATTVKQLNYNESKKNSTGPYSVATYVNGAPIGSIETQTGGALYLITTTDLVTSTLLTKVFGCAPNVGDNDAKRDNYNNSLQAIYPQISAITTITKVPE